MPSFKNTMLAAASASVVAAGGAKVNVYYGQNGNEQLSAVCSTGVDYVTLAFINVSPENGGAAGYAGTNFANHCYAGYYDDSQLLYDCPAITSGFQTCKDNGVKVILSIGGVFSASSNYTVSTDAEAVAFAEFVWGAYGPYDEAYTGPRPFDVDGVHNAVDGFDFDIEEKFADEGPWNTMAATLRGFFAAADGEYLLTAAPQCAYAYSGFQMADILAGSVFDFISIQFYNNPVCNGATNMLGWIEYLADTPNAATPLYLGLPGSEAAASNDYLAYSEVYAVFAAAYATGHYGGIMLWDEYFASNNDITLADGTETDYLAFIVDLAARASVPPTSSAVSSTSVSSTSVSSTSVSSTSVSAVTSVSSAASASGASSAAAGSSAATGASSTGVSVPTSAPTSAVVSATGSAAASGYTTSTVRSTMTSTVVSCAPTVTSCPVGKVTTYTVDLYTTVCPISEVSGPASGPSKAATTPAPAPTPVVVSTLYSTSYETVTSCAPDVTDCPARTHTTVVAHTTTLVDAGSNNAAVPSVSVIVAIPASVTPPVVPTVAPSAGYYGNATSSFATVVSGAAAGTGSVGTGSVVAPSTTPSSPVTAAAGKVSAQVGAAALLAAAMLMI